MLQQKTSLKAKPNRTPSITTPTASSQLEEWDFSPGETLAVHHSALYRKGSNLPKIIMPESGGAKLAHTWAKYRPV